MGKEITTTVVLNGRATTGFNALADKVTQLGYVIEQLGGKVGEWEKESLETYKNYETYMLEAKGAMSATVKTSSELERAYAGLEKKAQEWASTTIFHTNDVAKAISEAAHAGWDYEKMLQGIPQAMVLAQAGNTDLSTGLDMLIKTINGTGTAFEDSGEFVDQWVMAANSSATTVSELGEAMEKMGATARFGDSTEELLTMLAVLANTGTVGSAAGTLLRNSMIRLIAPTKNAREAMEGLGVEADEISEAVGGDSEALEEINKMLEEAGFSAYTTEGKLKPFLQTFKDLYKATAGMTEAERNKVLSAIFPTRTITGAMALLQAAADDYDGLLEKIAGSEGYASKIAGIQVSGLMGSQELFLSKWEEFSRKIGEILSEPLESAYSIVGGFLDTLNDADPAILSAIAGAATALAGAGPVLISAGLAMKLFGTLGPYGTAILGAVIGVGALYGYFDKLNKLAMENNFGTLAVDMDAVNSALDVAGDDVEATLKIFTDFTNAANKAAEEYKKTGQTLTESLWTKMVTGSELTPKDQEAMMKMADDFVGEMETYLETAFAKKVELASLIYSGEDGSEPDAQSNSVYASILSLIEIGYDKAKEEAEAKSKELRDAMTSAFKDGKLTEAELRNIQEIMAQINELMAGLNPTDLEYNKLLNKSQRVSLESMIEFGNAVQGAKNAAFEQTDSEFDDLAAYMRVLYNYAVEHNTGFINPVTGDYTDNPNEIDIDALISGAQEQYALKRTAWGAEYDALLQRGWQNALATSDTGKLFAQAQEWLGQAQKGFMTFGEAGRLISDSMLGDQNLLRKSLDTMIDFYGGADEMAALVNHYRALGGEGNLEMANWLEQMVTMYEVLGGKITGPGTNASQSEGRKSNLQMSTYLADIYENGTVEDAVLAYYNSMTEAGKKAWNDEVDALRQTYNLEEIGRAYDKNGGEGLSKQVLEWLGAYALANDKVHDKTEWTWGEMPEIEPAEVPIIPEMAEDALQQLGPYKVDIYPNPHPEWDDEVDDLVHQGVKFNYDEKTGAQSIAALVSGEDALDILTYVDGDTEELHMAIMDEDGQTIKEYVEGDTTALAEAIDKYKNQVIRLYIQGVGMFAEGGRADEPSIFGEAGAEWAIPEEHSQRTADLLRAAANASGFTWGELLATNGGLNAGGGISVNIHSYAPTINATDASGVADELRKDKERLGSIVKKAVQSAIENMNLHNSIEVYA